jgi:hypothetical protein
MSSPNKPINRFEEVRKIIDSSNDPEMLKSCQGLLRDLIKINDMEELLERARASLYPENEKSRQFYSFFIEGLPPLEVSALADKCSGRMKILEKRAEKEKKPEPEKEVAQP